MSTHDRRPYQVKAFSEARLALMIPHPRDEDEAIGKAIWHLFQGFHGLDYAWLSDHARTLAAELKELSQDGDSQRTPRSLTPDQRNRFRSLVDDVANTLGGLLAENPAAGGTHRS